MNLLNEVQTTLAGLYNGVSELDQKALCKRWHTNLPTNTTHCHSYQNMERESNVANEPECTG